MMEQVNIDKLKECGKFATILKCILAKKGITQSDLADKVGFSKATISHYMTGKSVPSQKKLSEIAYALDISPTAFFGDIDDYIPYLNSAQARFSDALSKLLLQKGVTQTQLANAISVSRQAVNMYTKGKMFPTLDIIMRISDYLHVPLSDLINEGDETEPYEEMKLYVENMPRMRHQCKFASLNLSNDVCECKLSGRICDLEEGKCSSLIPFERGAC